MIYLREGLLVSAHMIVGIELGVENGEPTIDVHTPDGAYWSVNAEDLRVPEINAGLLTALANEIDRQCKEIGVAAFMDAKVKAAIDNRIQDEWSPKDGFPITNKPGSAFGKLGGDRNLLDDEIPF